MENNRVIEDRQWSSGAPIPSGSTSDKAEKYRWRRLADPGHFRFIHKKKLRIDLSYQREAVSTERVMSIARDFSWSIFGVVTVAETDADEYFVTDGAHRVRAAMLRGDVHEVPCMVFPSLGQKDEAGQFVGLNTTSKGVSAFDRHRAGIIAGDEVALMADKIVKRHGYKFCKQSPGSYETQAVGSVYGIVKRNADLAELTFRMLALVGDGLPIQNNEIKGLFYVINTNQAAEIDWMSFPLKNLSEAGLGMIQTKIKHTLIFRGKGGERVMGEAIAEIINKGQSKNKVALPS